MTMIGIGLIIFAGIFAVLRQRGRPRPAIGSMTGNVLVGKVESGARVNQSYTATGGQPGDGEQPRSFDQVLAILNCGIALSGVAIAAYGVYLDHFASRP